MIEPSRRRATHGHAQHAHQPCEGGGPWDINAHRDALIFSKDWKTARPFFQGLEISRLVFPRLGKFRRLFPEPWKIGLPRRG
jgi:hypothetical protein